jgi:hypothetical protein
MMHHTLTVTLFAAIALLLSACTTTDPYTGEQVVDQNATAALVGGLAIGAAAAYAASSDDDDDRHDNHHYHNNYDHNNNYHRSSSSSSPASGVVCHDYTRTCYKNGHQSNHWTRRTYGRDY